MLRIAANRRFALYVLINVTFALLAVAGYAIGGISNPRFFYLVLLFALCSAVVIDIDNFNGRYALLGLFMVVYFVSYGMGDLTNLFSTTELPIGSSQRNGDILTKTEIVILVGGIVWVLAYRTVVLMVNARRPMRNVKDWPKRAILVVGLVMWAVGTYAMYMWHVHIVPDTTNEATRKGLASLSTWAASAYILGQMVQPLGILFLSYALYAFRNMYLLPIVIGMVIFQVLLGFVVDIKGMAMSGGLLVMLTAVLIDGRIPKAWLAAFALFVVLLFPVFQAYRTAIHGERGLSRTAVMENFGKVLQITLAAETRVNSGREHAFTFFERASLKTVTEIIVEKTGNGVDFQRGHTLSPILATFVPKIVWSGKQEVPTGQLVNKAFHMTDSDDIFISPSNLGELYWNFGWSGVAFGMGFLGAICGWVGARFNLFEYRTVTRILVTVLTLKILIIGFEGALAPNCVFWLRSLVGVGILHVMFARVPVASRLFLPADSRLDNASITRSVGEPLFPNLLT